MKAGATGSAAGPGGEGPLRTLLHHGGMAFAVPAFRSLRAALGGRLPPLVVHDDGSLTPEDGDRLQGEFPGCRVVTRAEADDRMAEALRRRPASAAYRRAWPWGLKLLDILQLADEPVVHYADGDILFQARLEALFPGDGRACALPEPTQTCLSASRRALVWRHGLAHVAQLNAGLFALPRGGGDPDFCEWFLGRPELNGLPNYSEQTCLAVLLARAGALAWEPGEVWCRAGGLEQARATAVAIHFIGEQKAHFAAEAARVLAAGPRPGPEGGLHRLRFRPAGVVTRGSALREKAGRWWRRGRGEGGGR